MTATCAMILATCGDWSWAKLARERALPSIEANQPDQLIVHHATNADVCGARNVAAQAAECDWMVFVDADDELASGYLDALRPHMNNPNLLLAPYVRYVSTRHGKLIVGDAHIPNAGGWPEVNDSITATAISTILFDGAGGWNQDYWPWSDWELWLRATKIGAKRIHIPGAVYIAHESATSENAKVRDPRGLHRRVKALHQQVWTG